MSPEPSLLQAEHPQRPQPGSTAEGLQPLSILVASSGLTPTAPCPSVGAPELSSGLLVGSQKSGAAGENPLPHPAGHAAFGAARGLGGFLFLVRLASDSAYEKSLCPVYS